MYFGTDDDEVGLTRILPIYHISWPNKRHLLIMVAYSVILLSRSGVLLRNANMSPDLKWAYQSECQIEQLNMLNKLFFKRNGKKIRYTRNKYHFNYPVIMAKSAL
jgi:hypothetical protein